MPREFDRRHPPHGRQSTLPVMEARKPSIASVATSMPSSVALRAHLGNTACRTGNSVLCHAAVIIKQCKKWDLSDETSNTS